MKSKMIENMALFMIIAFLLPLVMVAAQSKVPSSVAGLIFYGIQAATPSIAAIIVFAVNKELRLFFSQSFRKDHLAMAILLPTGIVCAFMIAARLLSSWIMGKYSSLWGTISYKQWIIILWAIWAEELGWRGFLEPAINKLNVNKKIIPAIVGLIWCLWHYHYFLQNGIDVPIAFFLTGCIIESYIYSYLMRVTKDNLFSAMTFHFIYNLMIHITAINPSDNNGSLIPYVTMMIMEIVVLFVLVLMDAKVKNRRKYDIRD